MFVMILVVLCISACSASESVESRSPATSPPQATKHTLPPTSTTQSSVPVGLIGVSECQDSEEACDGPGFTLIVPDCDGQTEAICSDDFNLKVIGRIYFNLECEAIRSEAVSKVVLATGEIEGRDVRINAIEDVAPNVMVAVENPRDGCGDWTMAVPNSAEPEALQEAICRVGDFPPNGARPSIASRATQTTLFSGETAHIRNRPYRHLWG